MLKSITLMILEGYDSFDNWVYETRTNDNYYKIIGLKKNEMPGVGTYYDFIDRLIDGEYKTKCKHTVKPSSLEKGPLLRNLKKEKKKKKDELENDGRAKTVILLEKIKEERELPNPDDLLNRLQFILNKLGIEESINRGLINAENVEVSGDGSCLEAGASHHGKRTCKCRKNGNYKCDCDRLYHDNLSDWGYDSYNDYYYFGQKFYQIVTSNSHHDLPLSVGLFPASHTDFTMSMETFERFIKFTKESSLDIKMTKGSFDAGHDAIANYEYFEFRGILPCIALNPRTKEPKSKKNLNEKGIPVCPGNIPMRFFSRDKKRRRQYYNCPVKRNTHRNGKCMYITHLEECPLGKLCQPETKMGPVVYVAEKENLRLHPVIRRNSKEYKRLYNLRSGVERSNNQKTIVYKLDHSRHRKPSIHLLKLFLISLIEHGKAWVAEDLKKESLQELLQRYNC